MIYLDYNATTPVRPTVFKAIEDSLRSVGNPSSVHKAGRKALHQLETAREIIAHFVHVPAKNIIFTSGATEACAMVANACKKMVSIVSAIEHDAIIKAVESPVICPATLKGSRQGTLDLVALEMLMKEQEGPVLLHLMAVNNETGVIQPIKQAVEIVQRYGGMIHVDATQAIGKIETDFWGYGIDFMSFSSHKIGGPMGVGGLAIRNLASFKAMVRGGGQEHSLRGGTQNLSGIMGFGAAITHLSERFAQEQQNNTALKNLLLKRLSQHVPNAKILFAHSLKVDTVVSLCLEGVGGPIQVMRLDLAGIGVSFGAACSSGKVTQSRVLLACGLTPSVAGSTIRVSFGWATTAKDIEDFVEAYGQLSAALGQGITHKVGQGDKKAVTHKRETPS